MVFIFRPLVHKPAVIKRASFGDTWCQRRSCLKLLLRRNVIIVKTTPREEHFELTTACNARGSHFRKNDLA